MYWSINKTKLTYATALFCDNNQHKNMALDFDNDEQSVMTPKPVLQTIPMLLETKQFQPALNPNSSTAQDAAIYSNAELAMSYNRVLYSRVSDTTLKLLGKVVSHDSLVISGRHPTDICSKPIKNRFDPYNVLRVGLHSYLSNIAPLFLLDWFADASMEVFGFPRYILTECG